ncbi:MAG: ParB/RepB/Spo0J family partition protein [Oscillospiraceae bacterium]|nr:ParB/RepB/Spo0J family partition protein [Oscillospiraceae bacterium]
MQIKENSESVNIVRFKMLKNENLFDSKYNTEDIEDTLDLENSINELGFTDPIEVTDFFDIGEGNYTIISGHRRRMAGVKADINKFPCIIRSFKSEEEVKNYILLSNSYRDSSKDPLLYCKRYKAHEAYLEDSSFKGNIREEIAKRLGISVRQANRYNRFNKIISPVWDLVRDGVVGMSSVLEMANFDKDEQEAIFNILLGCIKRGEDLPREKCENIIKEYKSKKNGVKKSVVVQTFNFDDDSDDKDEDHKNRIEKDDVVKNITKPNDKILELDKIEFALKGKFTFSDKGWAIKALDRMQKCVELTLAQMKKISEEYEIENTLNDKLVQIKDNLDVFMKEND